MKTIAPAILTSPPTPWFMTAAAFEGMLDTQPIDINWWPMPLVKTESTAPE